MCQKWFHLIVNYGVIIGFINKIYVYHSTMIQILINSYVQQCISYDIMQTIDIIFLKLI